jgi:hypothetical protein
MYYSPFREILSRAIFNIHEPEVKLYISRVGTIIYSPAAASHAVSTRVAISIANEPATAGLT